MKPWCRNLVRLAIGAAATVFFLLLFLGEVDLSEAWLLMLKLPGWTMLAALALVLVNIFFMTLRWRFLFGGAGYKVEFWQACSGVCLGRGANNIIPARGGDLLRIESMREQQHIPAFVTIGTLFAERLLDGIVLAAWIVLGAVLIGQGGTMLFAGIALSVGAALGIALVILAARNPDGAERFIWRATRRLPQRWHIRITHAAANFVEGLGSFTGKRRLLLLAGTSIAMWLADVAMYRVVGDAYDLGLGIGGYFLLEGIGNLSLAIPTTAGGLGTFDYLTLLGTKAIGVPEDKATAYVLTMHALAVVPVTILGLLFLKPALPRLFKRGSDDEPETEAGAV